MTAVNLSSFSFLIFALFTFQSFTERTTIASIRILTNKAMKKFPNQTDNSHYYQTNIGNTLRVLIIDL